MNKTDSQLPVILPLDKIKSTSKYCCYMLSNNDGKTYIGSTNNFKRRIRQHNKEITGGARYTSIFMTPDGWKPVIIINGFKTHSNALSFEWRMKRYKNSMGKLKRVCGLIKRIENLFEIIKSNKVTNNCCPINDIGDLRCYIKKIYYDKYLFKINNIKSHYLDNIDFFQIDGDNYLEIQNTKSNN